jgi:hypothetical protein
MLGEKLWPLSPKKSLLRARVIWAAVMQRDLTQYVDPLIMKFSNLTAWPQKIRNWYGNHKSVPTEDADVLVPVGTTWNARRVVGHLHKDDIAQKLKDAGSKPTDSGWLQAYHKEVTEVWNSLGDEDEVQEKYSEMARTWNDVGPPEEAKRR